MRIEMDKIYCGDSLQVLQTLPENNQEWQGYNRLLESNIRRSGKL